MTVRTNESRNHSATTFNSFSRSGYEHGNQLQKKQKRSVKIRTAAEKEKERLQWTHRQVEKNAMAERLYRLGLVNERHYEEMLQCSRLIKALICPECNVTRRIVNVHFCKCRFCPICQWRLARQHARELRGKIKKCQVEDEEAGRKPSRYILLTLTMRNMPWENFRVALRRMLRAWGKLVHRWANIKKDGKTRKIITGWVRTVEITAGKDGTAHPHIHAMLQVPAEYFDKESDMYLHYQHDDLMKTWRELLEVDYDPRVDIRAISDKGDGLDGAIREVSKYISKGSDLSRLNDKDLSYYFNAISHGSDNGNACRLYASGGRLRINEKDLQNFLKVDRDEDEEELPLDICPNCGASLVGEISDWDDDLGRYNVTVGVHLARPLIQELEERIQRAKLASNAALARTRLNS